MVLIHYWFCYNAVWRSFLNFYSTEKGKIYPKIHTRNKFIARGLPPKSSVTNGLVNLLIFVVKRFFLPPSLSNETRYITVILYADLIFFERHPSMIDYVRLFFLYPFINFISIAYVTYFNIYGAIKFI